MENRPSPAQRNTPVRTNGSVCGGRSVNKKRPREGNKVNKKCTETKNVTTKWDRPSKRQRQHRHVQERSEFELEPEPASDCHFEGKHRTPLGNFPSDILQNIKDNNDNGYDGDNSSDQVNGILIPAAESCPNTDDDPRSLPSIDQLDAVDGSVDSQPDHGDLPEFMHPQFALTWSLESARMLDDLEWLPGMQNRAKLKE
ncbi:hypothetical protein EYZ11_009907 [Aspergillus tanneri]|uniref:Uncharacterized protein n=1 Tax=Aspergillus tanneri TaxID=1220188 RepID=A0A4S3J8T1_9EURO|nr:hypothetical protein EYZ11_009907 [Aspergillus tanneri]